MTITSHNRTHVQVVNANVIYSITFIFVGGNLIVTLREIADLIASPALPLYMYLCEPPGSVHGHPIQ